MKLAPLVLASVLATLGCNGKKEDAPAAGPAPTGLPSLTTPTAPAAGAPAHAASVTPKDIPVADIPIDLEALSKAVNDYCKKTQANPSNLDEIVRGGFLKAIPKLPPGKQFYIDDVTYKVGIRDIAK